MNILLTGATGFIGQYFLQQYGNDYHIINFSFSNDDINKLDLSNIDVVIHLSALVHKMGGASKENYWNINVNNTKLLAEKAKNSGVKQFIFMSSIKVFGEESNTAYNEASPTKPQDYYGSSKLAAENILQDLGDDVFKIAIIRTPIVYGKGVKANIASLVNLINKVLVLPLKNTNNKRTMVFIANLCFMMNQILKLQANGVFLAADDQTIATSELVIMIAKYQSKKLKLINIPLFTYLLHKFKPSIYQRLYGSLIVDNTLSKARLKINKQISIEQGIKTMLSD